jgi:3'-5' exoribonuclease
LLFDSFRQVRPMLDIPTLAAGDAVHHPLLVLDLLHRGGDHPRTTVVFGNRTGRIESAPFWAGRDEAIAGLAKGVIAQVVGTVTTYRDALQLEAKSVRALPKGSVELADFVPSVGPVEKYWQYLDDVRHKLTAPRLRAIADLFFADEAFRERFERCPGAPGVGHHALLGGLLQHVSEVVSIGRQMARVARADEELVAVAAMLHDIGKLESYTWEKGIFDTTERGRLAGHVVIGAMMFREALAAAGTPPCTDEEAMILEHLILSHHGRLEFGSPVRPMTLEAEILSMADDASAKTASIGESYASGELFPGDARLSTRRVWQLDNRWLFRLSADFGRQATAGNDEAADQHR